MFSLAKKLASSQLQRWPDRHTLPPRVCAREKKSKKNGVRGCLGLWVFRLISFFKQLVSFVSSPGDYDSGCVFMEPDTERLQMCDCWALGGFRWWFFGVSWMG